MMALSAVADKASLKRFRTGKRAGLFSVDGVVALL